MVNALYVLGLMMSIEVLTSAAEFRNSYCKLEACQGPNHTLCKYSLLQTSKQCGKITSSTLTADEVQELLDIHNRYRRRVASGREYRGKPGPQPASTNLGPLKWDKELADIAQTWANQCHYGHESCRSVGRFRYGQNIAYKGTTESFNTIKLSDMVTLWYNEVDHFNRNHVKSYDFSREVVSHYSQMMWAKTTLVGCGAIRYNSDGVMNMIYLVCNYGPTGNWLGEEMYKIRRQQSEDFNKHLMS